MAKRKLNEIFKRLENEGFEFEEEIDGDRTVIIIILPRSRRRVQYFAETDQFQFRNTGLEEKQDREFMVAFAKDITSLSDALE